MPIASTAYTGYGFDICHLPSIRTLRAWSRSPFRALAVYVGGINEGCPQPLTGGWVRSATALGWHLIPTYVSLQAPHNRCGCHAITPRIAFVEGVGAGDAAARDLRLIGIGRGNIVYDDMEGYTRGYPNTPAVLNFLNGWTHALHHQGYYSGVYSSASSGIADLVAQAERRQRTYANPDDIWIASWNGLASTRDAHVPSTLWVRHERIHQFRGNVTLRYGGVSLSIDEDFCAGMVVSAATL
jgi:hypothetical protein